VTSRATRSPVPGPGPDGGPTDSGESRDARGARGSRGPQDLPLLRGEAWSGLLLTRLVVGSALWLLLGSLAAAVLALLGLWRPWVAGIVLVALLVLALRLARLVPARPLPVWAAVATVVLSVGATVWVGATHSEQVLPRRDSGSYLQSAIELSKGHTRPIRIDPDSVGGPDVLRIEGVTLGSPAFYAIGTPEHPAIQPQFPVGPSAWYSVAWWVGGAGATFWLPALLFGLTVLGIGLMGSVLTGPRWGPLAAVGSALLFPLVHVGRSTYSEPLALPLLAAGLLALTAAARSARLAEVAAARGSAAVAGILIGGGVVVRVDALREAVLVVPLVVLGLLRRQPHARTLAVWLAVSAAVTTGVTALTSSKYLASIAGSLLPLVALGVVVCVGGVLLVKAERRGWSLPQAVQRRLPLAASLLVVVVGVYLASRPLWQVGRQSPADPGSKVVAVLQAMQGLPVDGGRTYSEMSVVWMSWWVGPVALVVALVAAAVLAQRATHAWLEDGDAPAWAGPALVCVGSTVLTLYRPGITPDHPWADRRLTIALPTVVLLVVSAAAVTSRWSTRRLPYAVSALASVLIAAALLVPTALATWHHVDERVELHELAAVDTVCAQFRPGDVAFMVDSRAANEWPQVLRGYCGVPALSTTFALRSDHAALSSAVDRASKDVAAHGGRLVLLAADSTQPLSDLGLDRAVVGVDTRVEEDPRLLEQRPDDLVDLPIHVWLGRTG
jgi:hypothetical protein